jgi:hypothetical protein
MGKRNTEDTIRVYRKIYEILAPDGDSVSLAKDVWEEWEKAGTPPPDVDEIALNHAKHENGFFYDIVTIAERVEQRPLGIHYCAFCVDDYNFKAVSTADGYIVLVDDIFFQLLFFVITILMFDANGLIEEDELPAVKRLLKDMITSNYFNNRRYDFSQDTVIPNLLKKDYEVTEFANYFFHSVKAYIIAHEIGHHVLGHTSAPVTKTYNMNGQRLEVEVDSRSVQQEFEADNYGYKLFTEVSNTVDESISYAYCKFKFDFAPLFLFGLFNQLEKITEAYTGTVNTYATYPSPQARIDALNRSFSINNEDPIYRALLESLALLDI